MRARVSRKWYLVVIVLLYIGLLASFSLNVTLLMRKPVLNTVKTPDTDYGENPFDVYQHYTTNIDLDEC